MLNSKLLVLKQKIFRHFKESINLLGTKSPGKRWNPNLRALYYKLGRSVYVLKTAEAKPAGKLLASISRYLNFSLATMVSPNPRIYKILFSPSPINPGLNVLKSFIKRGINSGSRSLLEQMPLRKKDKKPVFEELKLMEVETEGVKTVKDPPAVELPPPHRCRLSCPLPPEEFIIPDVTEGPLPHFKSPTRRTLDYLLPDKDALKDKEPLLTAFRDTLVPDKGVSKAKEQTSTRPRDNFIPPKDNRKNYFEFKSFKSIDASPRVEISPKMSALLFEPDTLSLKYDLVNAPSTIFKDDVLVQVAYSGITATDVFVTEGKLPCGDQPVILGQEFSGKVFATGTNVAHVKIGDDVVVNPYSGCCACHCRYCSTGPFSGLSESLSKTVGKHQNGGWAEFVVVKKSQVFKIPEFMGLDQAALVPPLSCVLKALSKLDIKYGMDIFIQGLGLSGCLWAAVLHSRGHRNVFVADTNKKKKQQFESLRLNYEVVPTEDVAKLSADVVIDCAGSPHNMETSFSIVNSNGTLCFFRKPRPSEKVRFLPYEIIDKAVTIVGSSGSSLCFAEAVDVASSLSERYLGFDKLGVQTFDLKDYKKAFEANKSGNANKILFKVGPFDL